MIIRKFNYDKFGMIRDLWRSSVSNLVLFTKLRKKTDKSHGTGTLTVDGLRGFPYLKMNDAGKSECISCMLCKSYCPARCIHIEAEQNSDGEYFGEPVSFDIELLRCISCGLCLDVCPTDAIGIEGNLDLAGHAEQEWLWSKEDMLSVKEETSEHD